jgi:hypothetical protein
MAQNKAKKHRNHSNLPLSQAMHGLNSSAAASPQESREDRKRPRSVNKKVAINYGW